MSQNFQSSFIPKGPLGESSPDKKKNSFFGFLMFLVFVGSLVSAGGVYFYKSFLKADIENMKIQLVEAGKSIDQKSIDELVDFSDKLSVVRTILLKHQVVSGFMNSLASSTVKTIYFKEFKYDNLTPTSLAISLSGVADSYGAIALQQDILSKNQYWKSVDVTNLKLAQNGGVEFGMDVVIDPKIVAYNPYIPPSSTSTATTTQASVPEEDQFNDLDNLDMSDFSL